MTINSLRTSPHIQRGLNTIAILMPYLAVWLGLYVFHSAWAAIFGYHAGIILLVTLAGAWPRADAFFARAPVRRALAFGLAGWSAGALLYFLLPIIQVSPRLPGALLGWGLTSNTWPIFILYSMLVNPWLEEIFWRGWLGREDRHPIFRDAIFAGFHLVILAPFFPLFWLVVAFLILTFSGWLWRQATRTEKSLLASTLFHMSADVSILLVVWSTVTNTLLP